MARTQTRRRSGGKVKARAYVDMTPGEEPFIEATTSERAEHDEVGTLKFIRRCAQSPNATENFIDLNDRERCRDIEDYYENVLDRLNILGHAPEDRVTTFEDLLPAGWRKARTQSDWHTAQKARRDAQTPMNLAMFPTLLAGMSHNALQRIAASAGRRRLANIDQAQAEQIMRAYAIGQSYLDKPEEVGHFLGWFFASIPDHLNKSSVAVELLNKFIRLDPTLCFTTFAAVPNLGGVLLDRHEDERKHNMPLDMTDALNFRALRFFAMSHMSHDRRPRAARDITLLPPPQMTAPGPDSEVVQARVNNMAHRAFSRLPAAWADAELKRHRPMTRAERRSRNRIRVGQEDVEQRAIETRNAVAAASRLIALTIQHKPISSIPDEVDDELPDFCPTPPPELMDDVVMPQRGRVQNIKTDVRPQRRQRRPRG